ncbi:hypothetical protein [Anatilimnocola floriformis]|uniref:hypothetical protein n=1 Tax=Anatilimnocola floriformis TaxID=2948575 RepID=UPI0020C29E45|nr:hypothetical protein [Anatilimnocola floriformis]
MKQRVVIANQQYFYTRTETRFYGGPRDGELLACQDDTVSMTDADGILWQTNGGMPGEFYFTLSEYGSQFLNRRLPKSHCYQVTARWICKEALCLILAYRGLENVGEVSDR